MHAQVEESPAAERQTMTSMNTAIENITVQEDNNIIVRYPCSGHHYFHAHCLHSWLQLASARYLNSRRTTGPHADHRLQVTCRCCREYPHQL